MNLAGVAADSRDRFPRLLPGQAGERGHYLLERKPVRRHLGQKADR